MFQRMCNLLYLLNFTHLLKISFLLSTLCRVLLKQWWYFTHCVSLWPLQRCTVLAVWVTLCDWSIIAGEETRIIRSHFASVTQRLYMINISGTCKCGEGWKQAEQKWTYLCIVQYMTLYNVVFVLQVFDYDWQCDFFWWTLVNWKMHIMKMDNTRKQMKITKSCDVGVSVFFRYW